MIGSSNVWTSIRQFCGVVNTIAVNLKDNCGYRTVANRVTCMLPTNRKELVAYVVLLNFVLCLLLMHVEFSSLTMIIDYVRLMRSDICKYKIKLCGTRTEYLWSLYNKVRSINQRIGFIQLKTF